MKGFRAFLLRGNVIDLAVAVVVGVAFNAVVQALVQDLITPLVAAVAGKQDFSSLTISIGSLATISYGKFLNALISFVLISAVVYFLIVAPMSKLMALTVRKKEATERECPECLSQIPVKATRCKYCTATVPPVGSAAAAVPVE